MCQISVCCPYLRSLFHVEAISSIVQTPLIVDADTGFGNAVNVWHTVRRLERAGASAIQIEDQTFPKRCGHLEGKSTVPAEEMVEKIHAAVEGRDDPNLLIVAAGPMSLLNSD